MNDLKKTGNKTALAAVFYIGIKRQYKMERFSVK